MRMKKSINPACGVRRRKEYSYGKSGARPRLTALFILLAVFSAVIKYFSTLFPRTVEKYYSLGFYRIISRAVSKFFGLFPFSCAEIFLYTFIAFGIFIVVIAVKNAVSKDLRAFLRIISFIICVISAAYFLFMFMWGLNYSRLPVETSLGYKTGTPKESELAAALSAEITDINSLCGKVRYTAKGNSYYPGGFKKISAGVGSGYERLSARGGKYASLFGGTDPHPKGVLLSPLMSYTGIEGIFVPFTYEANVDTDLPDFVLPFDAAHESAHLIGFAREQEANFAAYLADCENTDPYFRYSAHMEAYIYLSNALYDTSAAAFEKIRPKLDRRAAGDLQYYSNYINSHETTASEISGKVNDSYLKAQGQRGVVSYDMFVTLLIEKYRG